MSALSAGARMCMLCTSGPQGLTSVVTSKGLGVASTGARPVFGQAPREAVGRGIRPTAKQCRVRSSPARPKYLMRRTKYW